MTALELQRRLDAHTQGQDVAGGAHWGAHDSVVAVHPGVVDTDLANNFFKQEVRFCDLVPYSSGCRALAAESVLQHCTV
jgi:hypothetical protein